MPPRKLRWPAMIEHSPSKPAYRIKELVQRSPVGRSTIFDAISRGELRARKLGRATIVLSEDFDTWLRSLPEVKSSRGA